MNNTKNNKEKEINSLNLHQTIEQEQITTTKEQNNIEKEQKGLNKVEKGLENKGRETIITEGLVKNRDHLFKKGYDPRRHPLTGKPKGAFSLKTRVIKSLKQLEKKDKKEFQQIITDYWKDKKKRIFLMEMIDGKPKQEIKQDVNLEGLVSIEHTLKRLIENDGK